MKKCQAQGYPTWRPMPPDERFAMYAQKGKTGQCWNWAGSICKEGYGIIAVERKLKRAHRYSWELVHGEIPTGISILHKCDNRSCVNPSHLYPGTQFDNMRDRAVRGRGNHPRGEDHYRAKLTNEQVRAIYSSGAHSSILSLHYRIPVQLVSDIRSGRKWKSVTVDKAT